MAAAASLKTKADTAPSTSTIAIAAGLADSAGVEEIAASVTALKAGQADPAKFVPVEQVAAVNTRLATLEGERAEREVAAAIQGGKLVPALKDWGLNLFKTNEQGWRDFVGAAPSWSLPARSWARTRHRALAMLRSSALPKSRPVP